MLKAKIAAVSYLNAVPFIYGIEHAQKLRAELFLAPPSSSASAYLTGEADIALVPAGALPKFKDAKIITDYCIGSERCVRTVMVMSDSPINEVRRIWLDSHSMSSTILVRILAAEFWKISPEFKELADYTVEENPVARKERGFDAADADHEQAASFASIPINPKNCPEGDAFLFIGDKVFEHEGEFQYNYDLVECWRELTGLPFVFAIWIARNGTPDSVIDALQESLTFGVEHIWEAALEHSFPDKTTAYDYLTTNIDFLFDSQKRKALKLFWEKGLKVVPHANPG